MVKITYDKWENVIRENERNTYCRLLSSANENSGRHFNFISTWRLSKYDHRNATPIVCRV